MLHMVPILASLQEQSSPVTLSFIQPAGPNVFDTPYLVQSLYYMDFSSFLCTVLLCVHGGDTGEVGIAMHVYN